MLLVTPPLPKAQAVLLVEWCKELGEGYAEHPSQAIHEVQCWRLIPHSRSGSSTR
jgi:hypothetical protein